MKRILFSMAAIAAVFTSCSNNAEETVITNTKKELLKVETGISTRAVISSFPTNAQLGLFVTSGNLGSNYEGNASYINTKSTYSGTAWSQTPAIYLTNAEATVYAYYPWDSNKTNGATISLESNSQTDYMYGTHTSGLGAINNGNSTVKLTMKHALALVQFNLAKSNYPGVGKLTAIEVCNSVGKTSLFSEGTINIQSGVITNATGKNASTDIENTGVGLLAQIPSSASPDESTFPKIMLLPTAATVADGDIFINFTIDGKVYKWNVPTGTAWKSGTKNTYTVTISGTAINVGTVVISDWTTGVTGNAGIQ